MYTNSMVKIIMIKGLEVKLLGVFSSREKAKNALSDIKKNPKLEKKDKYFSWDSFTN